MICESKPINNGNHYCSTIYFFFFRDRPTDWRVHAHCRGRTTQRGKNRSLYRCYWHGKVVAQSRRVVVKKKKTKHTYILLYIVPWLCVRIVSLVSCQLSEAPDGRRRRRRRRNRRARGRYWRRTWPRTESPEEYAKIRYFFFLLLSKRTSKISFNSKQYFFKRFLDQISFATAKSRRLEGARGRSGTRGRYIRGRKKHRSTPADKKQKYTEPMNYFFPS